MNLQPTTPLLPAVCLSTRTTIEAAKYRGELTDYDQPWLPYPGITSYLLSIPAATKPLPTIDVIPTPAVSTVTRKQAGAAGILVSFKELSVQATDDNLAEAIASVMSLVPDAPHVMPPHRVGDYVYIPRYQKLRRIERVEQTKAGTWFYAFRLIAAESDEVDTTANVLTRFAVLDIIAYNGESELRRAS